MREFQNPAPIYFALPQVEIFARCTALWQLGNYHYLGGFSASGGLLVFADTLHGRPAFAPQRRGIEEFLPRRRGDTAKTGNHLPQKSRRNTKAALRSWFWLIAICQLLFAE